MANQEQSILMTMEDSNGRKIVIFNSNAPRSWGGKLFILEKLGLGTGVGIEFVEAAIIKPLPTEDTQDIIGEECVTEQEVFKEQEVFTEQEVFAEQEDVTGQEDLRGEAGSSRWALNIYSDISDWSEEKDSETGNYGDDEEDRSSGGSSDDSVIWDVLQVGK